MKNKIFIITFSIIIGLVRLFGIKNIVFQAAAHVWMGLILGRLIETKNTLYLWVFVLLSILEVLAFFFL